MCVLCDLFSRARARVCEVVCEREGQREVREREIRELREREREREIRER